MLGLAASALALAACAMLRRAPADDPFRRDPYFLDTLLAWDGPRHETLGPTGDRLFADRLLAEPGLRGTFRWIHASAEVPDLLRLEFETGTGPLAPADFSETWHPSFQETRFRLGWLDVAERKFIAADDVAVALLRFENHSGEEQSLLVAVGSGSAALPARNEAALIAIDLARAANVPAAALGFAAPPAAGRSLAGIPFRGVDSARSGGRSAFGVGSGAPASAALRAEAPIGRSGRRLHLLGNVRVAGPGDAGATATARAVLQFEDGDWTAVSLVPAEEAPAVATLNLPAGRAVQSLALERDAGGFSPALAAVTLELPTEDDPALALVGARRWFGEEVHDVVIAEASLPDGSSEPLRVRDWNRRDAVLNGVLRIAPGAAVELRAAHAFGADRAAARSRAAQWLAANDPLGRHRDAYHAWYDQNCPRFECGDPFLDRLWWYRWFVVRHALARPGTGNLPGPVFYEGRHGTWYPRVIAFSSAHIVAEARWLADPEPARNQIRAHLRAAAPSGLLQSALVDWSGQYYAHWLAVATQELDAVHPDDAFLAEVLPGLERDVAATASALDPDQNGLPVAPDLYATGMEYQPSTFFFSGYDNTAPPQMLERPDLAAYLYGNARALEQLHRKRRNDAGAARMNALAWKTQRAALEKLWSDQDGLFYARRPDSGQLARCAEIVAFYPWFTGLVPDQARYARAFDHLFDPAEFSTPVPFASCSRRVPVFSAAIERWPGPGGHVEHCMWNGPVWPHANSVVANAIGRTLLASEHHGLTAAHLRRFLEQYARAQFEGGDPRRPLVQETLDAETGAAWGCPDYFHSSWCDLIVRYAATCGWPKPTPAPGFAGSFP